MPRRWFRRASAPAISKQIVSDEIRDFLSRSEGAPLSPVNLDVRIAFNPNITTAWFTSVMGIINNVTMLAIILAGAAIVREREHGTMDHLLVMPVTPFEIAMSKVWANGLVITVAAGLSLLLVVRMVLGVPIVVGSIPLFMLGVVIYLFFACAIGIFIGTVARSMPQLGLLFMLVFLADEHAVRQQYAAGKHAAVAGDRDAGLAVDAFRVVRAGDPLSRRRHRRGVAAVPPGGGDRRPVPRPRDMAVSLQHGAGARRSPICLYCAAAGLATVFRESVPAALAKTLQLPPGQIIQFAQTA